MVKIFNLGNGILDEVLDFITEMPQPVYTYYYDNNEYLVVSTKEINEDDLDGVSSDLISDLNDEDDDDFDIYDDQA